MRTLIIILMLFVSECLRAAAPAWYTDLNAAKAAAQKENKAILLDFTGSDWCVWCQRLKGEVFDTREFGAYASKKLILVEVDFPQQKRLPADLQRANQALAVTYRIEGYPSLVILDSNGKLKGRSGYQPGGPKPFLAELDRMLGSTTTLPDPQPVAPAVAEAKPAPAVQAVPAPKPVYDDLQLKGITGSSKLRLALINGHTFAAGEESKLTLGDKAVVVKCLEIGESEVKVQIDGKVKSLSFKK